MKGLLCKLRTSVTNAWREKNHSALFVMAVGVSFLLYLLLSCLSGGRLLTAVFFRDTTDAFMDFFHSIRDASLGVGAYTERLVIYPPMANLIFMLLSGLTDDAYNATSTKEGLRWAEYEGNVLLITVWATVCVLAFAFVVYQSLKGVRPAKKWLFLSAALIGVPFLNLIERGNIMVLALIALMLYAMTYDSKSRVVRELGLLCLAFSFSLKLYPALFAWILIGDKRYWACFRCAMYSLALLILPSFAFGGLECLGYIVHNIFSFSSSDTSPLAAISKYSHIPYGVVSSVAYLWFGLCSVNFILSPFVHKERWKIWIGGCMMFLSYPSLTSSYGWLLFLIPLILICKENLKGARHLWYVVPMTVPFLFFPIPLPVPVTVNTFMVYFSLIAISAYAMTDTVRTLAAKRKARKEQKAA